MDEKQPLYRVMLIGDQGTGQSALRHRFITGEYAENSENGGSQRKEITVDGKETTLEVLHQGSRFAANYQTEANLRGKHGVIIVFDLTDQTSFENVKQWLNEVDRYASDGTSRILVATKSDSDKQVEGLAETAKEFAEQLGISYVEASAVTGANVDALFSQMVRQINQRLSSELVDTVSLVDPHKPVAKEQPQSQVVVPPVVVAPAQVPAAEKKEESQASPEFREKVSVIMGSENSALEKLRALYALQLENTFTVEMADARTSAEHKVAYVGKQITAPEALPEEIPELVALKLKFKEAFDAKVDQENTMKANFAALNDWMKSYDPKINVDSSRPLSDIFFELIELKDLCSKLNLEGPKKQVNDLMRAQVENRSSAEILVLMRALKEGPQPLYLKLNILNSLYGAIPAEKRTSELNVVYDENMKAVMAEFKSSCVNYSRSLCQMLTQIKPVSLSDEQKRILDDPAASKEEKVEVQAKFILDFVKQNNVTKVSAADIAILQGDEVEKKKEVFARLPKFLLENEPYQQFSNKATVYSNDLKNFVQAAILSEDQDGARYAIKQWMTVVSDCIKEKDYATAYTIYSALGQASLGRIIEKLPTSQERDQLKQLNELFSTSDNFKNIRAKVGDDSKSSPTTPLFFLLIKDIIAIYDANDELTANILANNGMLKYVEMAQKHTENQAATIDLPHDERHQDTINKGFYAESLRVYPRDSVIPFLIRLDRAEALAEIKDLTPGPSRSNQATDSVVINEKIAAVKVMLSEAVPEKASRDLLNTLVELIYGLELKLANREQRKASGEELKEQYVQDMEKMQKNITILKAFAKFHGVEIIPLKPIPGKSDVRDLNDLILETQIKVARYNLAEDAEKVGLRAILLSTIPTLEKLLGEKEGNDSNILAVKELSAMLRNEPGALALADVPVSQPKKGFLAAFLSNPGAAIRSIPDRIAATFKKEAESTSEVEMVKPGVVNVPKPPDKTNASIKSAVASTNADMKNPVYEYGDEDCDALTAKLREAKGVAEGHAHLLGEPVDDVHVLVLDTVASQAPGQVVNARNLNSLFNKNDRLTDNLFLQILSSILLQSTEDKIQQETIDAVIHDHIDNPNGSAEVKMIAEINEKVADHRYNKVELGDYIDRQLGEDLFDEIRVLLVAEEESTFRILFPFNLGDYHWVLGEVEINRNGNNIAVNFRQYDPLGGGKFSQDDIDRIDNQIIGRLKKILSPQEIVVTVNNYGNDGKPRQTEKNKKSCGAYTINDLFLRADGKNVGEPDVEGATNLRKWQFEIVTGQRTAGAFSEGESIPEYPDDIEMQPLTAPPPETWEEESVEVNQFDEEAAASVLAKTPIEELAILNSNFFAGFISESTSGKVRAFVAAHSTDPSVQEFGQKYEAVFNLLKQVEAQEGEPVERAEAIGQLLMQENGKGYKDIISFRSASNRISSKYSSELVEARKLQQDLALPFQWVPKYVLHLPLLEKEGVDVSLAKRLFTEAAKLANEASSIQSSQSIVLDALTPGKGPSEIPTVELQEKAENLQTVLGRFDNLSGRDKDKALTGIYALLGDYARKIQGKTGKSLSETAIKNVEAMLNNALVLLSFAENNDSRYAEKKGEIEKVFGEAIASIKLGKYKILEEKCEKIKLHFRGVKKEVQDAEFSSDLRLFDAMLLQYQKAPGDKAFADAFKLQVQQALAEITPENIFSHAHDFLVLKLCVSVLNDEVLAEAFEAKKTELAQNVTTESAIRALEMIDRDENLKVVEKAERLDVVMGAYFALKGKIPKDLRGKYAELSANYIDQIVIALRQYGEGLYANIDVDKIQRQIVAKIFKVGAEEQRREPGQTDAMREFAVATDKVSNAIVKSVIGTSDTNAAVLSAKRWIEIAALAYESGDIQTVRAVLAGLDNMPVHAGVLSKIEGTHAQLKEKLAYASSTTDMKSENMHRAEDLLAGEGKLVIPFTGNTLTALAFAVTRGEVGLLQIEEEGQLDRLRHAEKLFRKKTKTELEQVFGQKLLGPLLVDDGENKYRKLMEKESEGKTLMPKKVNTGKVTKSKDFVPEEVSGKPAGKATRRDEDTAKDGMRDNVHRFHLKKNGGTENDFEHSSDYDLLVKIQECLDAYLKDKKNNPADFRRSPEYLGILKLNKSYADFLIKESDIKKIKSVLLSNVYRFHLEKNGYAAKDYSHSPEYAMHQELEKCLNDYLKAHNDKVEGFEESPEYIAVLDNHPAYAGFLEEKRLRVEYKKECREKYIEEHMEEHIEEHNIIEGKDFEKSVEQGFEKAFKEKYAPAFEEMPKYKELLLNNPEYEAFCKERKAYDKYAAEHNGSLKGYPNGVIREEAIAPVPIPVKSPPLERKPTLLQRLKSGGDLRNRSGAITPVKGDKPARDRSGALVPPGLVRSQSAEPVRGRDLSGIAAKREKSAGSIIGRTSPESQNFNNASKDDYLKAIETIENQLMQDLLKKQMENYIKLNTKLPDRTVQQVEGFFKELNALLQNPSPTAEKFSTLANKKGFDFARLFKLTPDQLLAVRFTDRNQFEKVIAFSQNENFMEKYHAVSDLLKEIALLPDRTNISAFLRDNNRHKVLTEYQAALESIKKSDGFPDILNVPMAFLEKYPEEVVVMQEVPRDLAKSASRPLPDVTVLVNNKKNWSTALDKIDNKNLREWFKQNVERAKNLPAIDEPNKQVELDAFFERINAFVPKNELDFGRYNSFISELKSLKANEIFAVSVRQFREIFELEKPGLAPVVKNEADAAQKQDYLDAISRMSSRFMRAILEDKLEGKDKDLSRFTIGQVKRFLQQLDAKLEKDLSYNGYMQLIIEFKIDKIFNMNKQEFENIKAGKLPQEKEEMKEKRDQLAALDEKKEEMEQSHLAAYDALESDEQSAELLDDPEGEPDEPDLDEADTEALEEVEGEEMEEVVVVKARVAVDEDEANPKVTLRTKLVDLVKAHMPPITLVRVSEEDVRAALIKSNPNFADRELESYKTYNNEFIKKEDGWYRVNFNRQQNYIDFGTKQLETQPNTVVAYYIRMLDALSNIESKLNYYALHALSIDREMGLEQNKDFFAIIRLLEKDLNDGRFPGNKEPLLAALTAIKAGFEAVEQMVRDGAELPAIDAALRNIQLSELQKIREDVADELGQKTYRDLRSEYVVLGNNVYLNWNSLCNVGVTEPATVSNVRGRYNAIVFDLEQLGLMTPALKIELIRERDAFSDSTQEFDFKSREKIDEILTHLFENDTAELLLKDSDVLEDVKFDYTRPLYEFLKSESFKRDTETNLTTVEADVVMKFADEHKKKIREYVAPTVAQDTLALGLSEILQKADLPVRHSNTITLTGADLDGIDPALRGTAGRIEIRYFAPGEKNTIKLDHVLDRINYLCDAAQEITADAKIKMIREKFIKFARENLSGIDTETGEAFSELAGNAKKMFLELQKDLVFVAYPGMSLPKAIKALDKHVKEISIREGRPTVIHVMADGMISANIPKFSEANPKSFPGTYRSSKEKGVTPNSALELTGYVDEQGNVDVKSAVSRSTSWSVLGLKGEEREKFSYYQAEAELKNLLSMMDFEDGATVNIHSMMLLTPVYRPSVESFPLVKLFYAGETEQARNQIYSARMLDGKPLTLADGRTVTPSINVTNASVKKPKRFMGLDEKAQEQINNIGFAKFIKNQYESLKAAYPNPQVKKWLEDNCYRKPTPEIIKLEAQLKTAYAELLDALENSRGGKAAKAKVEKLEAQLSKEYGELYKDVKAIWKNNPPAIPVQDKQFAYFADALKLYSSGEYVKKKTHAYLFVTAMTRANELAGVLSAKNCKTGKDRTKESVDQDNLALKHEHDTGLPLLSTSPHLHEYVTENLQTVREHGTGQEVIKYTVPGGLPVSMKDNEWEKKPEKKTSMMSKCHKIRVSLSETFKHWLKSKSAPSVLSAEMEAVRETAVEPMTSVEVDASTLSKRDDESMASVEMDALTFDLVDLELEMSEGPEVLLLQKLRGIDNKVLAEAMVETLINKGLGIPKEAKVNDAVREINQLIAQNTIMPSDFFGKYKEFLGILERNEIIGINEFRKLFIIAIVAQNKPIAVKEFDVSKESKELSAKSNDELNRLSEEIKLEIAKVEDYIQHVSDALGYLGNNSFDVTDDEMVALDSEIERLLKLTKEYKDFATMISERKAEMKNKAEARVISTATLETFETVTVTRPGVSAKEAKKEKADEVRAYYPETNEFKTIDPERVQDARDAGAHLIEIKKSSISYTEPAGGVPLDQAQLETIVKEMVKEAFERFQPKAADELKFEGSEKLKDLAVKFMAEKIESNKKLEEKPEGDLPRPSSPD